MKKFSIVALLMLAFGGIVWAQDTRVPFAVEHFSISFINTPKFHTNDPASGMMIYSASGTPEQGALMESVIVRSYEKDFLVGYDTSDILLNAVVKNPQNTMIGSIVHDQYQGHISSFAKFTFADKTHHYVAFGWAIIADSKHVLMLVMTSPSDLPVGNLYDAEWNIFANSLIVR
jgi:hypothetical protein